MSGEEKKFNSVKQDKVLKNLMLFNQKILKDGDKLEGIMELSMHKDSNGDMSASSFIAVPKANVYQAFELLLKQGVSLFDVDGSFAALGLSTDEVMRELFFNFMRIVTEKLLVSDKLNNLKEIEETNPQVRDFVQNHMQALYFYGILGSEDEELNLED